jgi:hypothetical protein
VLETTSIGTGVFVVMMADDVVVASRTLRDVLCRARGGSVVVTRAGKFGVPVAITTSSAAPAAADSRFDMPSVKPSTIPATARLSTTPTIQACFERKMNLKHQDRQNDEEIYEIIRFHSFLF